MWQANVFTIFPEAFPGNLGVSLVKKALDHGRWSLSLIDLKNFPAKSDRIDSTPYSGGNGMILSPITFEKAFDSLPEKEKSWRKIYFSPRGRKLNQADLQEIANEDGIIMLCGRYEGVDQRILDYYEMEEVSVGDFVLAGGEVAAMVIVEGCVRLLPGVLGKNESIDEDSFQKFLLEYNQYTKPSIFKGQKVPDVLLSGNHTDIEEFKSEESKRLTMIHNPDLWAKYIQKSLLDVF
ncbi:MAG: tRNA (guanosine(37)-N1)-methyltransferase TrmD [Holosporaceae bacterium]|jgi:tRNA (guanine37-N1)-methyltransferase|nr:tRNA (guanosine(37)-N1)-methyltransferase TrmD [Holosporaceae bacterium]